MKTNWQAAIPDDVMNLIYNVVDNLNDMPISEEWASKTADKLMAAFAPEMVTTRDAGPSAFGGRRTDRTRDECTCPKRSGMEAVYVFNINCPVHGYT